MISLAENRIANFAVWFAFFAFGCHSLFLGHSHENHFNFHGSYAECHTIGGIGANYSLKSHQHKIEIDAVVSTTFVDVHNSCPLAFNPLSKESTSILFCAHVWCFIFTPVVSLRTEKRTQRSQYCQRLIFLILGILIL